MQAATIASAHAFFTFISTSQAVIAEGAIPIVTTNVPQTMLTFECSNPVYGQPTANQKERAPHCFLQGLTLSSLLLQAQRKTLTCAAEALAAPLVARPPSTRDAPFPLALALTLEVCFSFQLFIQLLLWTLLQRFASQHPQHPLLCLAFPTSGSIRIPAAYCGTVGFKPTKGRVGLRHVNTPVPGQAAIAATVCRPVTHSQACRQ